MIIRPATLTDIPGITAIYWQAVMDDTATFEIDPPDEVEMAERMRAIQALGHPYLVSETGGAVAGYAYASTFRSRTAFTHTLEDSVYVDILKRGRGIGRALLAALIDAAAKGGFTQMIAVIGDSRSRGASIAMHGAVGFVEAGHLKQVGRKHGQWLDVTLMQRGLAL
jgi:L-amino acid N-acyltransferase YncA